MRPSAALLALCLLAGTATRAVDRIPLEITGYHVFVELSVEGTPLSFAFDSGAGGVGINRATADRLGLSPTDSGAVTGAAGSARVPLVSGLRLRLGELRLDRVTAALVALDHLEEAIGRPVDGIIGRDVLEGRLVVLDHDRNVVEIHERSTFSFEQWGEPCPLSSVGPITVDGEILLVRRPDGAILADEVVLSSPAAEARLTIGDELRAIDGEEVSTLALAAVRDRLREPGRTLVLVVAGAGKLRTVELHTRALLDRAPFPGRAEDRMPPDSATGGTR